MTKDGSRITLRQLEIFLAAVENRSFAAAAETLSLSAPAVSMQMSKLGEELGAVLFEKEGRSIQPTEIANALVPYARQMTTTLTDAVEMVKSMQGELDNRVRVAMVSTARNFGPQLFQEFQKHHPRIDLQITIANRRGVIEALETGQIDLALMGRPPRDIAVDAVMFGDHPLVIIAPPDHPLARKHDISKEEIAAEKFLVREAGSGTRISLEIFFADVPGKLDQLGTEMGSNETIKQAVMAGLGIAFISAHTIEQELQLGRLVILDVVGMPIRRQWFAVARSDRSRSPAMGVFESFLTNEGAQYLPVVPKTYPAEMIGSYGVLPLKR